MEGHKRLSQLFSGNLPAMFSHVTLSRLSSFFTSNLNCSHSDVTFVAKIKAVVALRVTRARKPNRSCFCRRLRRSRVRTTPLRDIFAPMRKIYLNYITWKKIPHLSFERNLTEFSRFMFINCPQTKFVAIILVLSVFFMRFFAWQIFLLTLFTFRTHKRDKQVAPSGN